MNVSPEAESRDAQRTRQKAALISVAVGFGILLIKVTAYWLTGSAAILSDAVESVVHQFAIGFALFSVYLASRPPDQSHPYGHGKVEYFSAGFEGALIALAAVTICYDAIPKLYRPIAPTTLDIGTALIALAAAINLALGLYLKSVGRRTHSLTLVADGKHVLTDSWTSLGVIVGLCIMLVTGWSLIDPLVALLVAANILWVGSRLMHQSVRGLMDAADPELLTKIVDSLQEKRRPGWIDIHRLRAQHIGLSRHLDLHLTVPRFWDVNRTHAEQADLAAVVEKSLPGHTGMLVHLDPCVDDCCRFCSYEPCPIRASTFVESKRWTMERAVARAEYPPDSEWEP